MKAQLSSGVIHWNLRAAIRPTASQREIHAQAEFTRFIGRKLQRIKKLVRKKWKGLDAGRRVVQHERINWLDLKAADAGSFHFPHFSLEFRLTHGRAKPPPAHHDAAVVRRLLELLLKLFDSGIGKSWRLLRKRSNRKTEQQDQPFCSPQDISPCHFLAAPCFLANHWATSASSFLRSGFFCAMASD